MNAEFTKKCAELANNFAAAGGAVLEYTGKDAAVAALPDTNPPLFAAVGTVEGIRKVLPGEQAAEPGAHADMAQRLRTVADACESGEYMPTRATILRSAADEFDRVAAHLASQSQAATIPCCGDPNCYDCDRVPVKVAAPTQASTAQTALLREADLLEKYFALHATLDVAYIADSLRVAAGAVPKHEGFDPDRAAHASTAHVELPAVLFDGKAVYDEIVRERGKAYCGSHNVVADTLDAVVRLMHRAAPATPSQGKADSLNEGVGGWISVDEETPDVETDVLVRGMRGDSVCHDVAGLFRGEWLAQGSERDLRFIVAHWMPLPPAPIRLPAGNTGEQA